MIYSFTILLQIFATSPNNFGITVNMPMSYSNLTERKIDAYISYGIWKMISMSKSYKLVAEHIKSIDTLDNNALTGTRINEIVAIYVHEYFEANCMDNILSQKSWSSNIFDKKYFDDNANKEYLKHMKSRDRNTNTIESIVYHFVNVAEIPKDLKIGSLHQSYEIEKAVLLNKLGMSKLCKLSYESCETELAQIMSNTLETKHIAFDNIYLCIYLDLTETIEYFINELDRMLYDKFASKKREKSIKTIEKLVNKAYNHARKACSDLLASKPSHIAKMVSGYDVKLSSKVLVIFRAENVMCFLQHKELCKMDETYCIIFNNIKQLCIDIMQEFGDKVEEKASSLGSMKSQNEAESVYLHLLNHMQHIINHFKYKKAAELKENCIYTKEFTSYTYFIHKESIKNIEHVKYYFTEIYEVVENRVHYINKKKGIWKIYDIVNKNLKERRNKEVVEDFFDKSEFLPHLKAESVDVQFPDIDDEEL